MGLELAFREKPDVVILDLRMPGIGGEAILKELKQNLPQTKVLVFTAWTGDETRARVLEKGADLFIEKPSDFEILKEKVIHLIQ
jgi:DNA-binding response OmpR family regulator